MTVIGSLLKHKRMRHLTVISVSRRDAKALKKVICRCRLLSRTLSRKTNHCPSHESSKSSCSWFIQTELSTSHSSVSSPLPDELRAVPTKKMMVITITPTKTIAIIGPAGKRHPVSRSQLVTMYIYWQFDNNPTDWR